MDRSNLIGRIRKSVAKQGNQGATILAPILEEMASDGVFSAGEYPTSQLPTLTEEEKGTLAWDTDLGSYVVWDGSQWVPLSSGSPGLVEIEYADLAGLASQGELIPGTWYRIIDYECTTVQENTQSAGHAFDIIVRADDESHLNENAFAAHHEGDEYFANCKLEAWELKYCLYNDTDRFAWADETNGKGVVYWMKDEWNNECPYDFKNIQFIRHEKDLQHMVFGVDFLDEEGDEMAKQRCAAAKRNVDNSNFKSALHTKFGYEDIRPAAYDYASLLDYEGIQYSDDDEYVPIAYDEDWGAIIIAKVLANTQACFTFSTDLFADASLDGGINNVRDNKIGANYEKGAMKLNNNVFFGMGIYSNSIEGGSYNNSLGPSFYGNSIGLNFIYNSCDELFSGNTINTGFQYNSCGRLFGSNIIGPGFVGNSIGSGFRTNLCDSLFTYNSTNEGFRDNLCGSQISYNSFGPSSHSNSIGPGFEYNLFHMNCIGNSFGSGCNNNVLAYCYDGDLGNGCTRNHLMTCTSFRLENGVYDCIVDDSPDTTQYFHVFSGYYGGSGSQYTLPLDSDNVGTQFVAKKSDGTVVVWNPADKVST